MTKQDKDWRPDWVVCIKNTDYRKSNVSICGRQIWAEFAFENINHAFNNPITERELRICPKCANTVLKVIEDGKAGWKGSEEE